MSAYAGRALKWDWATDPSKLDLSPEKYELGDVPVAPRPHSRPDAAGLTGWWLTEDHWPASEPFLLTGSINIGII